MTDNTYNFTRPEYIEYRQFLITQLGVDLSKYLIENDPNETENLKNLQYDLAYALLTKAKNAPNSIIPDDFDVQSYIKSKQNNNSISKIKSIAYQRDEIEELINARGGEIVEKVNNLNKAAMEIIKTPSDAQKVAKYLVAAGTVGLTIELGSLIIAACSGEPMPKIPAVFVSNTLQLAPALFTATLVAVTIFILVYGIFSAVDRTFICVLINDTDSNIYVDRWSEGAAGKEGDVYMETGSLFAFPEDVTDKGYYAQLPRRSKTGEAYASFFALKKNAGFYGCECTMKLQFDDDNISETIHLLGSCPMSENNRINASFNDSRSCKEMHHILYKENLQSVEKKVGDIKISYHVNSKSGSPAYAIAYIRKMKNSYMDFNSGCINSSCDLRVVNQSNSYLDKIQNGMVIGDHGYITIGYEKYNANPVSIVFNAKCVPKSSWNKSELDLYVGGINVSEGLDFSTNKLDKATINIPNYLLMNGNNTFTIKNDHGHADLVISDFHIIADKKYRERCDWMESLPDNLAISEINIPGTHDSAAINAYKTLYACQRVSITDQLKGGIRLLDIRLKVKKENEQYVFYTCHGNIGSAIGANEYQSFISLMNECEAFLKAHKKECIIMSLKIDDWSKYGEDRNNVLNRLAQIIAVYPIVKDKASNIRLGQGRGKIYLLNRITDDARFGAPVSWDDATTGQYVKDSPDRHYRVFVQDKFKGLKGMGTDEKFNLVTAAMRQKRSGEVVLNYASACLIYIIGVNINDKLLSFFGSKEAPYRIKALGWTLFDNVFDLYDTTTYGILNISDVIIESNNHYSNIPNKFEIIE